jgi:hypothetical protein
MNLLKTKLLVANCVFKVRSIFAKISGGYSEFEMKNLVLVLGFFAFTERAGADITLTPSARFQAGTTVTVTASASAHHAVYVWERNDRLLAVHGGGSTDTLSIPVGQNLDGKTISVTAGYIVQMFCNISSPLCGFTSEDAAFLRITVYDRCLVKSGTANIYSSPSAPSVTCERQCNNAVLANRPSLTCNWGATNLNPAVGTCNVARLMFGFPFPVYQATISRLQCNSACDARRGSPEICSFNGRTLR